MTYIIKSRTTQLHIMKYNTKNVKRYTCLSEIEHSF